MIKIILVMMILSFNLIQIPTVDNQELAKASLKQFNHHSLILEETNNNLIRQEVIFTVFRDKTLGTQIKRSELVLNEKGIYTYQDKVCVATATYECLNSNSGSCKLYNFDNIPNNYHYFKYYDELVIILDGVEYDAIVVDSCGSCSTDKNENHQRVDILVSDDFKNTKSYGEIIYEKSK